MTNALGRLGAPPGGRRITLLRTVWVTVGIASIVASCSMPEAEVETTRTEMVGTWELTALEGSAGPVVLDAQLSTARVEAAPAWLEFHTGGSLTGEGPCNDLTGRYTVEGDSVILSDVVMSAGECLDADGGDIVMRAETAIVEPLLAPGIQLAMDHDTDETLRLATQEVAWQFRRHGS